MLRLRGGANALDMAIMIHESSRFQKKWKQHIQKVCRLRKLERTVPDKNCSVSKEKRLESVNVGITPLAPQSTPKQ
eukprot:2527609-Amphidinium_carterae.1